MVEFAYNNPVYPSIGKARAEVIYVKPFPFPIFHAKDEGFAID